MFDGINNSRISFVNIVLFTVAHIDHGKLKKIHNNNNEERVLKLQQHIYWKAKISRKFWGTKLIYTSTLFIWQTFIKFFYVLFRTLW